MKERGRKYTIQKKRDDAVMNFVSRQAQEAILDPNLPESYKDEILNVAIKTLLMIVEKRSAYITKPRENQKSKKTKRFAKRHEKEICLT